MDQSNPPCIPSDPDISGIGVRVAIYTQNLLSFLPVITTLWDREVSEYELEYIEAQSIAILIIAFAILISAIIQTLTLGLSNFHAAIILNLSWMNNTNTFIWFLLFIHSKTDETTPTWGGWGQVFWQKIWRVQASGYDIEMDQDRVLDPDHVRDDENTLLKSLSKNLVLVLGSLHLSLMAAIGIWLWSNPGSFSDSQPCAVSTVIAGNSVPLLSKGLQAISLVIYALILLPGVNLGLPCIFFIAPQMYYNRHYRLFTRMRMRVSSFLHLRTADRHCRRAFKVPLKLFSTLFRKLLTAMRRISPSLYARLQGLRVPSRPHKLPGWSKRPLQFGLVILAAINVVMLIDIEETVQRNSEYQDSGESQWGFGQVLSLLLLALPLRDILAAVAHRREREQRTLIKKRRRNAICRQLCEAIRIGDVDTMMRLVQDGANVNVTMDERLTTPLLVASSEGSKEMVKILLGKGANPNSRDLSQRTALLAAVSKGYCDIAKVLLENGADPDVQDDGGRTPLHIASTRGQLDIVKLLVGKVDDDMDVSRRKMRATSTEKTKNNTAGLSLGMKAASSPSYIDRTTLKLTLLGATLDMRDGDGCTPLHYASVEGHVDIVRSLIDEGAKLDVQDSEGKTPLSTALAQGQLEVVSVLINKLKDGIHVVIDLQDCKGYTLLHVALSKGYIDVAKILIEKGANINLQDGNGMTPLHVAVTNEHEDVVRLLLSKGADLGIRDNEGRTPLLAAIDGGHTSIAEVLRVHGGVN